MPKVHSTCHDRKDNASWNASAIYLHGGKGSSRKRALTEMFSSASAAVAATWLDQDVRRARLNRKHTLVNGVRFGSYYKAVIALGIDDRFTTGHIKIRSDLNKQPPGTRLRRWGVEIENVPIDDNALVRDAETRSALIDAYRRRLEAGEFDAAEAARKASKNTTLPEEYHMPSGVA